MQQRSTVPPDRPTSRDAAGDVPPPDVAEFIRFCHRRREAGWPELYDEMCAVASHRAYNGWDHDQLAARGLTFSLFEMPRLAAWVRIVLEAAPEPRPRPLAQPAGA
jgi:hypothetical protein